MAVSSFRTPISRDCYEQKQKARACPSVETDVKRVALKQLEIGQALPDDPSLDERRLVHIEKFETTIQFCLNRIDSLVSKVLSHRKLFRAQIGFILAFQNMVYEMTGEKPLSDEQLKAVMNLPWNDPRTPRFLNGLVAHIEQVFSKNTVGISLRTIIEDETAFNNKTFCDFRASSKLVSNLMDLDWEKSAERICALGGKDFNPEEKGSYTIQGGYRFWDVNPESEIGKTQDVLKRLV